MTTNRADLNRSTRSQTQQQIRDRPLRMPNPHPTIRSEASLTHAADGKLTLDTGVSKGKANDKIDVSSGSDGKFNVSVNGQRFTFTADEMKKLTIQTGNGNNDVTIGRGVPGFDLKTGTGKDNITNFADGMRIDAGNGANRIRNFSSNSSIKAGNGADDVQSVGANNKVDLGDGRNRALVYGNANQVSAGKDADDIRVSGENNQVSLGAGNNIGVAFGKGNELRFGGGNDFGYAAPGSKIFDAGGSNRFIGEVSRQRPPPPERPRDIIPMVNETEGTRRVEVIEDPLVTTAGR